MATPIYVFTAAKMAEAWYQLSQQERDDLWAKVRANRDKIGIKNIICCDASWSSAWEFFLVDEYSDIDALHQHTELDNALQWFRYVGERVSWLGTKIEITRDWTFDKSG
jgi:hypothetical protein